MLDCADPETLSRFWTEALGYRRRAYADPYTILVPVEPTDGPELLLQRVPEPKSGKNRMHLDVNTDDVETEAARLIAHGATRVSSETLEEYGMRWIVMSDPEGNEFCVCQEAPAAPEPPVDPPA